MEANRSFPAEVTSPRAARHFVARVIGHPDRESTQTAMVLTSELVTNAVLHARTQVDVRVQLDGELLRVEVADGDPVLPGPTDYTTEALGGRGLFLVREMATAWGADAARDGKVVWFTLPTGVASRVCAG